MAERDGHAPDGGEESGPLRRCVATGERAERQRMIRFVLGPDRALVPDLAERLPGRGLWLLARRDVLDDPRLARAFARAAKGPVTVPAALREGIERLLRRRIAEHLGLARRAGQAVAGFVAAREWVTAGRAGLIVEALDGAEDGRRKLLSGARDLPVVAPLAAHELGAAFGREHVVHVALAPGRLAQAIARDAARLAGVRGEAQEGAARKDRLGG
ncbi:MAG: RNA-binding protein [Elioraea sp.]|nr:RNA-binding protein [Elioraea sp.]MDW8444944.1 RNA-binding protein [Acetobacteraceae bacterium]